MKRNLSTCIVLKQNKIYTLIPKYIFLLKNIDIFTFYKFIYFIFCTQKNKHACTKDIYLTVDKRGLTTTTKIIKIFFKNIYKNILKQEQI